MLAVLCMVDSGSVCVCDDVFWSNNGKNNIEKITLFARKKQNKISQCWLKTNIGEEYLNFLFRRSSGSNNFFVRSTKGKNQFFFFYCGLLLISWFLIGTWGRTTWHWRYLCSCSSSCLCAAICGVSHSKKTPLLGKRSFGLFCKPLSKCHLLKDEKFL